MSGFGARLALVLGALAAGGAGWVGARQLADDPPSGTALAAVDLFECPGSSDGQVSIGQVRTGDRVWLIGVTDDRWAVIRHPDEPDRPAWLPLAAVETNATKAQLPEIGCDPIEATGSTEPGDTTPPSTAAAATTVAPATSTGAGETTTTTTTIAADVTPPTVVVSTDRPYVYVQTAVAPCNAESTLVVTIVVADPTVPLSIRSIVATWNAPGGVQTAGLTPIGGNRFQLLIPANGPAGAETPLTLVAKGADGAGNVGVGQIVVSLRNPASFGCAG
jgi:hypothetical protein